MKIPLSWLKEYLPTQLTPEQIADSLTVIGLEVEGIEPLSCGDLIFEIALTPNLAHCASVRGIARELAAVTQETLSCPRFSLEEKTTETIDSKTSVAVEDKEACPRYACRLITGISVAPSPNWLKERIENCGLRSVNNIVDITNLVMLEYGHPLHAFDFDTLEEKKIVVRHAHKGEKLTTLDDKEHFPTEEMLMICDGKGPVAIAGIMGAKHTEVSDQTTSILLESAYFEPSQVRRTAKHLGIHTEASYRFERGTDPNGILEALERTAAWICEIAGGTALKGLLDRKEKDFPTKIVGCRVSRVNQILGTQLSGSEVETIFSRLGFGIRSLKEDLIEAEIPTYRHDIHHEIDLVEEAARLYGFDNIRKRDRATFRTGILPHSPAYLFEKEIRERLIAEGLQELLTCDLISPEETDLVAPDCMPSRSVIKLLNPRSEQQSILRPSLLPGLLNVVKINADHGMHSISGFEIGRLHFKTKDQYLEPAVVSLILTGGRAEHHWEEKENAVDFYDLKGMIENLLRGLKSKPATFHPSHFENFHPGRQAVIRVGEMEIGIIGEVHPETLKKMELSQPVYFSELNLEDLRAASRPDVKMIPLPQYPASVRDWTITVSEDIPVGALMDKIKTFPSKLLESVLLLDVYRSETLGSDRKNVTLRFVYRDRDKTLSVETVENEHSRITQKLIESEELS